MNVIVAKTYTVPDGRRGDIEFELYDSDAIRIERKGEFEGFISAECLDDTIDALNMIRTDMELK